MKSPNQLKDLQKFTIEEFQSDFDNLITKVENGESFLIQSEYGNVMIVPCKEYNEIIQILEKDCGEKTNEIEK